MLLTRVLVICFQVGKVPKRISKINEGDVLCFKNAGAYCFTMASNYNSRYKPSEILFLDNKAIEIRKRENIEDILRNQVEITL